MNIKSKIKIIGATLLVVPFLALAAGPTLADIINLVISYLNTFLVLMMGVAVVIFVYYVIKYFVLPNADRSEAGYYVMYSVVGFFIILSFWGIVNILQNTFGLQNEKNRPSSWTSFSNLFPGGGSRSATGPTFDGSGMTGGSIQRSGVRTQNDPEAGLRTP